ncbi:hypothetical protein HK105_205910 [Polyrhizophydium stewartii]|uniref:Uncharacterized protein n=1 Tax=Polyrhizophydium stewartii TaxID=2732419 RepID=A0ABR4N4Z7_9FUNG
MPATDIHHRTMRLLLVMMLAVPLTTAQALGDVCTSDAGCATGTVCGRLAGTPAALPGVCIMPGAKVSGPGQPCGGFVPLPPQCAPGLKCIRAAVPDLPGVCTPPDGTTTMISLPLPATTSMASPPSTSSSPTSAVASPTGSPSGSKNAAAAGPASPGVLLAVAAALSAAAAMSL